MSMTVGTKRRKPSLWRTAAAAVTCASLMGSSIVSRTPTSNHHLAMAFVPQPLLATRSHQLARLHVLSNPKDVAMSSLDSKDDEINNTNERRNPLFSLSEGETTTMIEGGSGLYQVQPSASADLLGGGEEVATTDINTPGSTDSNSVEPVVGESDFSYYYRDDDDMLAEREDRLYMTDKGIRRKVERCLLVGVEDLSAQYKARVDERYYDPLQQETNNVEATPAQFTLEESMVEMRELIRTSGMDIAGELTQRLPEINPKTYIGTGKVQEAKDLMAKLDCTTIIFDAELSPGQQKSLENAFNRKLIQNDFLGAQEMEIKVVDRTALILDIFAQHAKTREGKLQVDLALHEYRKPRLTKMWTHLERQSGAGGVGLRGPGESQLEIDRRLVRDRIIVLKQKIDNVQKQRAMHRRGRERTGLPILSLVGYTNAGKSTMLNYLTRAGVMAESILFATLDPTTRKVKLPGYKTHPEVLLTDTVGFIQKLPTHLVAAFRATLEEVQEADVLIHVIDVSNPTWQKQERAVRTVLADIDCDDKPIVRVLNKIDLLDPEEAEYLKYEAALMKNTVAVSSLRGDSMQDFVAVVEESLSGLLVPIEMEIPYSKGEELNAIHEQGNVETIDYRATGTYIVGRVPRAIAQRLAQYSVNPEVLDTDALAAKSKKKKKKQDIGDEEEDEEEIDWVALGRGRHKQPAAE
jgi:GTPase